MGARQIDRPSATEVTARKYKLVMDRSQVKRVGNRCTRRGEHLLMALGGGFASDLLAAVQNRETAVSNVNLEISGTL